jgi:4'-phosphopantetheinyl transferase
MIQALAGGGDSEINGGTSRMLHLHADDLRLWLAFCEEIADENLLADYRRLLTDEERQQEARFHFARDRHRYLITRALVRTVLSRYAMVAPPDWRFTADAYGRPRIVNEDDTSRRISFNISHTRSVVVLGVTTGRALGVDTEDVLARQADLDVAEHFFAADEVAQLRATAAELQQTRFFEYWTLKESYIKARGLGLSLPLKQFAFDLSQEGGVRIRFHAPLVDEPSRWIFWLLRAGSDHYVAVCAERTNDDAPQLSCTKVIPLRSEVTLQYDELRRSELIDE